MKEKEKMLSGRLYRSSLDALVLERQNARELLHAFNHLPPGDKDRQKELLHALLGTARSKIDVEPPFHCDYGWNIDVGENFYAHANCTILDAAKVTIGDHVILGPDVGIYTAAYPLDPGLRTEGYAYALPIRIGKNVWIGGHVVVLAGVTIGDNAVIRSGSVVSTDIPSNVEAGGNPCQVLRTLTEEDRKSGQWIP
ncbi:sugar O-acetyltransferase [Anaerotalea alkaliphila]|uniref:Acetyltransferase n=1 Tax=Anaerotalea alkaliphila TaxID=2662126 RepID=A0A7X5HTX5_9FIRM|nr:sugar O-acetyltransferase [Anaerotalea alkaliphila]NDL66597.1 sugar O-acetyltransferase [Anaerotalea alkaliphila]